MIKHIVMWTVKDEVDGQSKSQLIELLKKKLEHLPALIPEIQYFEVGLNFNQSDAAYDVCLISHFNSKEDLTNYQQHPEHVKVAKFVSTIRDKRAVADFEI